LNAAFLIVFQPCLTMTDSGRSSPIPRDRSDSSPRRPTIDRSAASANAAAKLADTFHAVRFGSSSSAALEFVPPLAQLCLKHVAANFCVRPTFSGIPEKFHAKLYTMLPPPHELTLAIAAPLLHDEGYWKRACLQKWPTSNPAAHDHSWKVLYFERTCQDALEVFDGSPEQQEDFLKVASHAKDYVFRLHLHQFLGRGDVTWLFDALPLLHSVSVTYGAREVGMQYDRTAFGMKLLDCEMMAKSLSSSQSLTTLRLHENLLDDEKIRRLSAGLKANNTLTDLDLSHNMISDRGVRSLCKFLTENVVLTSLNLCDNRVYADGAKYIGRALQMNHSLLSLNIRLNRIGDKGGRYVFEGLKTNSGLQCLNIDGNGLEAEAARVFWSMARFLLHFPKRLPRHLLLIRFNTTMTWVDLSSNRLGDDGGQVCPQLQHLAMCMAECAIFCLTHIG
jgi:hypothetical protein